VIVASKENGPVISLEDRPHHTDISGRLIACSSVTCGFSWDQYTQLCRLKVPLGLKLASSDQIIESGKDTFPLLLLLLLQLDDLNCPHSWHGAVSACTVSTSHSAKCDEHWFYRHQCHESIAPQTSSDTVRRPVILSQHFHEQFSCQVFQSVLLFTFYTVPSASNLSRNRSIVTRVCGGVPNSFLQRIRASFTFSKNPLTLHKC
jgi:hypothetical protein